MRIAHNPRSVAFVAIAMVTSVALLVWFTVIVNEAQTRAQQRRAYQLLTGEIMVPVQTEGHREGLRSTSRRLNAKQDKSPLTVAQQ